MNRRDEIWKTFLGRDPTPSETQDKMLLAEGLCLGDSDPFWGVVAFIYSRFSGVAAEHTQLNRALVEQLSSKIEAFTGLPQATFSPAPQDLKSWMRGHSRSARYFIGSIGLTLMLLPMATFWLGAHWARPIIDTPTVAETHALEVWEKTRVGHRLQAWAQLNGAGMNIVFQCDFGSSAKVIHSNGLTICYPSGSGNGYYLPNP